MLFDNIKVTDGQVYDFFSTRFDMRHLPKDVKVDRDGKIYYFEIGNEKIGSFRVESSFYVNELDEDNLKILDTVLNETDGLHKYFMSTIQDEISNIIDILDGDTQNATQQFPIPDQEKTVKEAQEKRLQRTWRFFANEDSPCGVDTYVMVSSQVCQYEPVTTEIMRMIRSWITAQTLSTPNQERVTLWQMKSFFDEGWKTCAEYRERIWGSELFQEATERVKYWVTKAWEKFCLANVSPMSEAEASFLNDPEFFLEQDDFFEGVWSQIKDIELRKKLFMEDPNRMVDLEDYRLNDYKDYVALLTEGCTRSADGRLVLGSQFMKSVEDEVKRIQDLAKNYTLIIKEKAKNDDSFVFNPIDMKEKLEQIQDVLSDLSEIMRVASGATEASNMIYHKTSDEEKMDAEAEAEAALGAFFSENWGV